MNKCRTNKLGCFNFKIQQTANFQRRSHRESDSQVFKGTGVTGGCRGYQPAHRGWAFPHTALHTWLPFHVSTQHCTRTPLCFCGSPSTPASAELTLLEKHGLSKLLYWKLGYLLLSYLSAFHIRIPCAERESQSWRSGTAWDSP